jgi:hypothetical protein
MKFATALIAGVLMLTGVSSFTGASTATAEVPAMPPALDDACGLR